MRGDIITTVKCSKGCHLEDGVKLCSVVPNQNQLVKSKSEEFLAEHWEELPNG